MITNEYVVKYACLSAEYVEFAITTKLHSRLWRHGCETRPRDTHP